MGQWPACGGSGLGVARQPRSRPAGPARCRLEARRWRRGPWADGRRRAWRRAEGHCRKRPRQSQGQSCAARLRAARWLGRGSGLPGPSESWQRNAWSQRGWWPPAALRLGGPRGTKRPQDGNCKSGRGSVIPLVAEIALFSSKRFSFELNRSVWLHNRVEKCRRGQWRPGNKLQRSRWSYC